MKRILIAMIALGLSTGCATKVRLVTAEAWDESGKGLYLGYWEGTCYGAQCTNGDGLVSWCSLRDDNSLDCEPQTAVNELLAQKGPAATSVDSK